MSMNYLGGDMKKLLVLVLLISYPLDTNCTGAWTSLLQFPHCSLVYEASLRRFASFTCERPSVEDSGTGWSHSLSALEVENRVGCATWTVRLRNLGNRGVWAIKLPIMVLRSRTLLVVFTRSCFFLQLPHILHFCCYIKNTAFVFSLAGLLLTIYESKWASFPVRLSVM